MTVKDSDRSKRQEQVLTRWSPFPSVRFMSCRKSGRRCRARPFDSFKGSLRPGEEKLKGVDCAIDAVGQRDDKNPAQEKPTQVLENVFTSDIDQAPEAYDKFDNRIDGYTKRLYQSVDSLRRLKSAGGCKTSKSVLGGVVEAVNELESAPLPYIWRELPA